MCVSRVLGGLWNKNYVCFPCRVDGGHGCVCVCGGTVERLQLIAWM